MSHVTGTFPPNPLPTAKIRAQPPPTRLPLRSDQKCLPFSREEPLSLPTHPEPSRLQDLPSPGFLDRMFQSDAPQRKTSSMALANPGLPFRPRSDRLLWQTAIDSNFLWRSSFLLIPHVRNAKTRSRRNKRFPDTKWCFSRVHEKGIKSPEKLVKDIVAIHHRRQAPHLLTERFVHVIGFQVSRLS